MIYLVIQKVCSVGCPAGQPRSRGLSKLAGTNEEYDLFAEQLLGSSPEKMERGVAVRGRVSGPEAAVWAAKRVYMK